MCIFFKFHFILNFDMYLTRPQIFALIRFQSYQLTMNEWIGLDNMKQKKRRYTNK